MFLSFCDGEGLNGISSLLYERIYFITVFPLILYRRRELNIGNRITFLVLFFGFAINNLLCNMVTFQSECLLARLFLNKKLMLI